jgi:hypothetical protein
MATAGDFAFQRAHDLAPQGDAILAGQCIGIRRHRIENPAPTCGELVD